MLFVYVMHPLHAPNTPYSPSTVVDNSSHHATTAVRGAASSPAATSQPATPAPPHHHRLTHNAAASSPASSTQATTPRPSRKRGRDRGSSNSRGVAGAARAVRGQRVIVCAVCGDGKPKRSPDGQHNNFTYAYGSTRRVCKSTWMNSMLGPPTRWPIGCRD